MGERIRLAMECIMEILGWFHDSLPRLVRSAGFFYMTWMLAQMLQDGGVDAVDPFFAGIYTLVAEWFFKDVRKDVHG